MMNKKINHLDLFTVKIGELSEMLEPFELGILLSQESNSTKTDILLENMLDYYVSEEMYEYAVVIRDEMISRK
jgi:hypothetical protein